MLRVKVICIGRLKEPYLRDACAEYQKRLSAFCRLEVEELAPARVPEASSDAQIAAALAQEGERILARIPSGAYVYAMCIEGKQRGSEQFSAELTRLTVEGVSSVCFLIGGSWGLSEVAKARAQARLSMSQMTFPHQLARVMPLRSAAAENIINKQQPVIMHSHEQHIFLFLCSMWPWWVLLCTCFTA